MLDNAAEKKKKKGSCCGFKARKKEVEAAAEVGGTYHAV
jgi:hypothetical protein